jgi:hypothetical protein
MLALFLVLILLMNYRRKHRGHVVPHETRKRLR